MTEKTVTLRSALERLYRCGQKQGWHYDGGAYEEEMEAAATALATIAPDQGIDDFANPAWWRGNERGVEQVVEIVNDILDDKRRAGIFSYSPLNDLRQRLIGLDVTRMEPLYFVIKLNDGEAINETDEEGVARTRFEIAKAAAKNSGDKVSLWQLFMTKLDESE